MQIIDRQYLNDLIHQDLQQRNITKRDLEYYLKSRFKATCHHRDDFERYVHHQIVSFALENMSNQLKDELVQQVNEFVNKTLHA